MRTNIIENRQIRVFISSTFQDMQDEREYLMRHTFPVLKQLAAKRDVALTELDLRWGITEEEAETGKVVEICLREIENSIPFFVGIIGNRYGWVPEKKDIGLNVTERFPDVKDYIEKHLSVTDMEMQFGVLNRKEDMHAFFYIKEQEEAQDNPEMLNRLKDAVRASRYPDSTYASPEDLGEQVKEAFIKLLDDIFPEKELSEVEKEAGTQRAFRNSLCRNYIRDEHNFDAIDKWLEYSDSPQFVITGASGMGKSALIANWIKQKEETKTFPYHIVYHFVGNGGNEGSHGHIAHALVGAIQAAYGFEKDKSKNDTDELDDLFQKVASEGDQPLLVVLDAVNQIADEENAKQLNWLPIPPKNVRILFSTLEDDKTMDVFRNRKYPVFTLQPLNLDRRRQLVETYLSSYGKKLKDEQITRIITDTQCENTLVLKTLLDELVNFGIFERLDERIDYFLRPNTMEQFYQTLLESYEKEFPFTEHVLSLIALSRSGLSEDELLHITKLSPLHWSQFYCSFCSHLTVRAGLVTFGHTYIRSAVAIRYKLSDNSKKTGFLREEIILFFDGQTTSRALHERPHQYFARNDDVRLHSMLMDMDVFLDLFDTDKSALIRYWTLLKEKGCSLEEYMPLAETTKDKGAAFCSLSIFCGQFVIIPELALKFAERSLQCTEKEEDRAFVLTFLGMSEDLLKNFKKALKYHQEALEILLKTLGEKNGHTAFCFDCVGCTYASLGDFKNALLYQEKAFDIYQEIYGCRNYQTAISLNDIGVTYSGLGDKQKALEYYQKALDIDIEIYGFWYYRNAVTLGNIASAYAALNDHSSALEYYQNALKIEQDFFGEKHPDTAWFMNKLGATYGKLGDSQKELEYALKAMKIQQEVYGDIHPVTAEFFNHVGYAYKKLGNGHTALKYALKALEIRKKVYGDMHIVTAKSFNNVGHVYRFLGNHQKALENYQMALKILLEKCGENHTDTIITFRNISVTCSQLGDHYYSMNDYEKTLKHYQKTLEIQQTIFGEKHSDIAQSLCNVGLAYYSLRDYQKALQNDKEALEIRQNIFGDLHIDTMVSYNCVGADYHNLGDYENALQYICKAKDIAREIEIGEGVAFYTNRLALIYKAAGDIASAVAYYQKAAELYAQLGKKEEAEENRKLAEELS